MSTRYQRIMWKLVAKFHGDQMYGKHLYTYHLEQVCEASRKAAKKAGYFPDVIDMICAVAIGHDILEDTDCSIEDLYEAGIPTDVVLSIAELTKCDEIDYGVYISNIIDSYWPLLVKKEDTFCNLHQSHKEGNVKRVVKYTKQLQLLYGA